MTTTWMRSCLLAGFFSLAALSLPQPAEASVVEHTVTPENVDAIDGIEVSSRLLPNGDLELTLRLAEAPMIHAPRLTPAPGASEIEIAWQSPRVAVVIVQAAFLRSASIRVMRDYGVVGYSYEIPVAAWIPRSP